MILSFQKKKSANKCLKSIQLTALLQINADSHLILTGIAAD